MNLEEYFKRIGFHGSYDELDLATLKLLHKQHVMSIPFENLSIHCGERIDMDLQVTFSKIVRSGHGGWCFENNFLFGWVLREMGYDTTTLGSRVFISTLNDFDHTETGFGKVYMADLGCLPLQTSTGFKVLVGWTYSEVTYKPEQGVDIIDMRDITDEEIEPILKEKFNLKLQNKLQPVNKKACLTI